MESGLCLHVAHSFLLQYVVHPLSYCILLLLLSYLWLQCVFLFIVLLLQYPGLLSVCFCLSLPLSLCSSAQRQVVISARSSFFTVFFPFLLYLRVSLLLFVFLFSSLLLHHYCHNFSDNSGLLPLSCAPHHLYIFRHLLLLPLTPPPLSSASGCQTLPSRPRGKAKAVDFSPHQAF